MAASLLEDQNDLDDDGIGELATYLIVFLDGKRLVVHVFDRPAVPQNSAIIETFLKGIDADCARHWARGVE
jgi:hypothetical protein